MLDKYHSKRDFKKTPEPKGKRSRRKHNLYIVQKHAARNLHYDFRLELGGVLLSWAIPKGPCLDPSIKRLAIHVEDHPLEYGSFEGIIPKGEYGAGTVMLWDKGEWKPLDDDPEAAYKKGHLRFELHAEKLNGRWDLIRFKEDHWFLVKHEDDEAKPLDRYDITKKQPNSVLTQQNIKGISDHYEAMWTKKGSKKAKVPKMMLPDQLLKKALPVMIRPQLPTLVDTPPEGENWLHEIKFDGYRILAFIKKGNIVLKSRTNQIWTSSFPQVVEELSQLNIENAVFDGEIVVLDEHGRSDFQLMQHAIKDKEHAAYVYYVFDLLYYDQYDLKPLPLIERKKLLEQLIFNKSGTLRYSDYIQGQGKEVYEQACRLSLEGIVSKRSDAAYQTKRSTAWLKIKCIKQHEFVIGGYSLPKGSRSSLGSLFLGAYNDKKELEFVGNVGTGFTESSLKELIRLLTPNQQSKNPFNSTPPRSKEAIWVKPVLVAEVTFSDWTRDGRLRHPSFKGLRQDQYLRKTQHPTSRPLEQLSSGLGKNHSETDKMTNPAKILYPEDKISKEEVFYYYDYIADLILPYIKNRPLTLLRCPDHYEECFYQRHFNKSTPTTLKSISIESKGKSTEYIYLDTKQGLLSLVQMGVLEIHPWGSQIKNIEYPDWITIDLDPAPGVPWKKVVQAAFEVKQHLEHYQLISFVKTTGGKGLHVVVPIAPEYPWEDVKQFTHVFVQFMERLNPKQYIGTMSKSKRVGKLFIDYLRNQRGATAISVYSTRARLHAPVSTPLHWDELTYNKRDTEFTIKNIVDRIEGQGIDPWADFFSIKQSLRLDDLYRPL